MAGRYPSPDPRITTRFVPSADVESEDDEIELRVNGEVVASIQRTLLGATRFVAGVWVDEETRRVGPERERFAVAAQDAVRLLRELGRWT